MLNEREFELINIIGSKLGSNQRDLSHQMDLSLGMVNMLIRRLISKGYIRIEQLNKRKVRYLLTPKGFSEKLKKSVKYTINTINAMGLIKNSIKEILLSLYEEGKRNFYVYSQSDLLLLIKEAFWELKITDYQLHILTEAPSGKVEGVLLLGKENIDPGINAENSVDLLREISKKNGYMK